MRRAALVAAVAVAGALVPAGCGDSSAGARGRLIFAEEFNGHRLNGSVWNTCHWWAEHGCTIASNEELEWYLPEQVRVKRGRLQLVAERRTVTGADGRHYPYRSGMVSSGPPYDQDGARFAFRYGRAEIRARMPAGKGLWSAFWLLPEAKVSKPEIDVVEILGHRPSTVEMHLHYRDAAGNRRQRAGEYRQRRNRRGWHRYAVDWRPDRVVWLVDGKPVWRVEGEVVPQVPMYLVLNLAVGGEWPGSPNARTRFPSRMEVDWVRVWR
jgi:beta-glucanase (GH16 family)